MTPRWISQALDKINVKFRKNMLKMGAILLWTDMKRLFNWNIGNFKSNFLSQGQPGSKSIDKFLSVLKMWLCCNYFFGNLIFAVTARTLNGNRLIIKVPSSSQTSYNFVKTRLSKHSSLYTRENTIQLPALKPRQISDVQVSDKTPWNMKTEQVRIDGASQH